MAEQKPKRLNMKQKYQLMTRDLAWDTTYQSNDLYQQDANGNWPDNSTTAYFVGAYGFGGVGAPVGYGPSTLAMGSPDDLITPTSWDGQYLAGSITGANGSWDFNAQYCGVISC